MFFKKYIRPDRLSTFRHAVRPLIVLGLATLLALALSLLPDAYRADNQANIAMIYLVATVFSAVNWGIWHSLLTALCGIALYQVVFLASARQAFMFTPYEWITAAIFIAASVIAARIGMKTRAQIEKERLENALHAERSQKEREELRAALLASVTHDLKTPLASVIGSLSSIRHLPSLNESARQELIVTAHEEAKRLDGFIHNILEMTKIEAGTIDVEKDWHYPAALVQRVTRRLQYFLQDRQVKVTVHDEDVQLYIDNHLIEQVIQNLIDNAAKYGAPGTAIEVDIWKKPDQGCIAVSNHGPGIPQDLKRKIFDKFYRTSKRDHAVAGTGLGLSICQAIMQMHGGSIDVSEAYPGDDMPGTRFTLCFPDAHKQLEQAA